MRFLIGVLIHSVVLFDSSDDYICVMFDLLGEGEEVGAGGGGGKLSQVSNVKLQYDRPDRLNPR